LDSFSLILLGLFQVSKLEKLLTNKGGSLTDGLFPSFQSKKVGKQALVCVTAPALAFPQPISTLVPSTQL